MIKVLVSTSSSDAAGNSDDISSAVDAITRAVPREAVQFFQIDTSPGPKTGRIARPVTSLLKSGQAVLTVLTAQFDILHLNTAMRPRAVIRDLAIASGARARSRPIVLHIHGTVPVRQPPPPLARRAAALLIRLAHHIVLVSRTELAFFGKAYPGLEGKAKVICNGTSNSASSSPRGADAVEGRLKAAFMGPMSAEHGLTTLMAACRRLTYFDEVDVDFFGDGELLPGLLELTQRKAFVRYRGALPSSERRMILQNYDALIFPAVRMAGVPMALFEAMSAGAVPLCAGTPSMTEFVTDGETGLLIQPGSANAIVEALLQLKRDAPARRSMAAAAQKFAAANLDARRNYAKLAEIYQQICPGS
jgi:glycosyltransferase involved in cell wall biosynthesis